jgi:hypothetical protein
MDKKTVKHIADVEVHKHEKKMHHGKVSKFAKGGKTNDQMKEYGRNLAKVANQTGSSRGR